jgi:hypothetical protein
VTQAVASTVVKQMGNGIYRGKLTDIHLKFSSKSMIFFYRVVSYGFDFRCGNIGINTRVDYFRNWIDDKISSN